MNQSGVAWLSETVFAGYAARTPTELALGVLGSLRRRLRLAVACCEAMGQAASDYTLHGLLCDQPLPNETPAYLHDHPMIAHVHRMPALCQVREVVSRAAFERTDYFNGIARPLGFNDHVIVRLQRGIHAVTLSLCRDRVFTRDECDLLRLLQRHLDVCWRRVYRPGARADGLGVHRLVVPLDRAHLQLEAGLAGRLRRYFPGWRSADRLPGLMHDWVGMSARELGRGVECRLPRVLTVAAEDSMLVCRYFPLPGARLAELHFTERWGRSGQGRGVHALSAREREVLHWVAEGKRDAEIGIILGLSAKTVGKHVEHVLAKLHVRNRTAAAGMRVSP